MNYNENGEKYSTKDKSKMVLVNTLLNEQHDKSIKILKLKREAIIEKKAALGLKITLEHLVHIIKTIQFKEFDTKTLIEFINKELWDKPKRIK